MIPRISEPIIIPIVAATAEEAREIQSALNEVLAARRKAKEKPKRQEAEERRRKEDMAAILARQASINRLRPSKERFMPLTTKTWPRDICR